MEIQGFAKELCALARQRAEAYPLKVYPGREKFDEKLDELANLALQASENVKLDKRVFTCAENFRFKPVFLCGYYKTGTSMLNGLLDFHSQALVLLPGSKLLFNVRKNAEELSKSDFFRYLTKEYVKALYNPAGHFPMNLLSESFEVLQIERYAAFVAYLKHFIDNAKNKAELLSSLPCALFASNGQFQKGHLPRIWIEKSVTNERHLKSAKEIFPKAKFLYIARNPYDNLSSIKRWYINSGRGKLANVYMYIPGLRRSLKRGVAGAKRDDFYFVKYEDIVASPRPEMQKIADFLGIDYSDSMTVPTVLGVPDRPNTSDTKEKDKNKAGAILKSRVAQYKQALTAKEIRDISVSLAGLMKALGYEIEKPASWYKFFAFLPLEIRIVLERVLLKLRT